MPLSCVNSFAKKRLQTSLYRLAGREIEGEINPMTVQHNLHNRLGSLK